MLFVGFFPIVLLFGQRTIEQVFRLFGSRLKGLQFTRKGA